MRQLNTRSRQKRTSTGKCGTHVRRGIAMAALAATSAILAAGKVQAGTETWVGNTDNTWSSPANWTGTNLPPVSGDSLIFAAVGSQGAALNDSEGALTLAGLNFDSANAAYIISPAAVGTNTLDFSLGAVISNNSAFLQTINTEAVGSSSLTVQGSGNIAMQRVKMSNSSGNNILTMSGPGILTLGNASATTSDNNLALLVNGGTVNLGMTGTNIAVDRGLTINAGQVIFTGSSTNMISSGQPVVLAGTSLLDLKGDSDTIGSLTGTTNTVVQSSTGTSTLSIGAPIGTILSNGSFAGNLINSGGGTLAITKTGNGSETLSGVNTYTGTTTLSAGTLNIAAASALPSGSTIAFSYGGVTVNSGGLVNSTGSTLTLSNPVTFPGNAVFNGAGNFNFTAGTLSVGGNRTFSFGGSGSAIFTGTLSNTTNSSSWTLTTQGNSNPYFVPTGTLTLGAINISPLASANASNNSLTLAGWANETVAGTIADGGITTASNLTVSNFGTTTLPVANTFHGSMILGSGTQPAGTVAVGNSQSLGLGTVTWNGIALQSTTALTGANAIANPITFQAASINPSTGNSGQVSGTNAIELSGIFTVTGGTRGLLVTNTGGTTISGNVYLSEANASGHTLAVVANGPTTISGPITNFNGGTGTTGNLQVYGSNTLTLSGANSYTGTTTLTGGGTLQLDYTNQNNSKLSPTASLTVNGGETLNLNGGSFTQAVAGVLLSNSGGGDLNITQSNGGSILQMAAITHNAGTGLNVATAGIATTNTSNSATTGIIGGWATVGGTDWAVSASGASNTSITAYATASYQSGADSTWTSTGNASNSGGGTLAASRTVNTLKVVSTGAGQSLDLAGNNLNVSGGGLLFTGSNDYAIKNGTIQPGGGHELILSQWAGSTLTISSVIANTSSSTIVTKLGSGTVVLGNTNTYTGTTYIDDGTLALGVDNAINFNSSSPQDIQMAGGGVFDLAGHAQTIRNVNMASNVLGGGTVTSSVPGGILTESNLTTTSNSNLLFTGPLALVLSAPNATATLASTISLNNPFNNFSGGVTVSGNGTFSTSQLSTAGTGSIILSSWVGTSDLRVNANTALGTGTVTINNARLWQPSGPSYIIANNIAVTANGGWLSEDNSLNAYLGTISTVSGSPLLVVGGDKISSPTLNLWGSMSGFTGTLAVDTLNSNVNLYGSAMGSANANLMFFNSNASSNGIVGWSGSIASPVTINFAELSTFTNSSGGRLTANVAANLTYQIGDNTTNTTNFGGIIQNGSGLVALTKIGTNNQIFSTANTYTGGTNVSGGTLTFAAPHALPNFTSLTVGSSALADAANHGIGVTGASKNNLFASSLSLAGVSNAWTGKVDLGNNDMVVQKGDLTQLSNQVRQGFNGGIWNNTGGIVSAVANADSTHLTALGVIQNSVDGTTTGATLYAAFDGATVAAATDVLVKYTYYGDANLTGTVDGTDYSRIDNAYLFNQTAITPLTGWFNGDFNYDGVINGSDYTLIDNAFNSQNGFGVIAAQIATPAAQIPGAAGVSSVPEPTALGLLGIGTLGLLRRRNRRNR